MSDLSENITERAGQGSLVRASQRTLATIVFVPFIVLWVFGGPIGAIISAVHRDLLGAVLSIVVPGAGAWITVGTIIAAIVH